MKHVITINNMILALIDFIYIFLLFFPENEKKMYFLQVK